MDQDDRDGTVYAMVPVERLEAWRTAMRRRGVTLDGSRFAADDVGEAIAQSAKSFAVSDPGRTALDLMAAVLPFPEEIGACDPLSWLKSLIEETRERGPRPDDEDPSAWHEMLGEVEDLHARCAAVIATTVPRPTGDVVVPRHGSDEEPFLAF